MRIPLLMAVLVSLPVVQLPAQSAPATAAVDTAGIRAQIEANERAVGRAMAAHDVEALRKLFSPNMLVNSPGNRVLTHEQVIEALRLDEIKYTRISGAVESFSTVGDVAVEMGHEDFVLANGPGAGKPYRRRFTDVRQRAGDEWVQIARQATVIGVDGATLYAPGSVHETAHP